MEQYRIVAVIAVLIFIIAAVIMGALEVQIHRAATAIDTIFTKMQGGSKVNVTTDSMVDDLDNIPVYDEHGNVAKGTTESIGLNIVLDYNVRTNQLSFKPWVIIAFIWQIIRFKATLRGSPTYSKIIQSMLMQQPSANPIEGRSADQTGRHV